MLFRIEKSLVVQNQQSSNVVGRRRQFACRSETPWLDQHARSGSSHLFLTHSSYGVSVACLQRECWAIPNDGDRIGSSGRKRINRPRDRGRCYGRELGVAVQSRLPIRRGYASLRRLSGHSFYWFSQRRLTEWTGTRSRAAEICRLLIGNIRDTINQACSRRWANRFCGG